MDLEVIVNDAYSIAIAFVILAAASIPFTAWAIVHVWGGLQLGFVSIGAVSFMATVWAARRS